MVAHNKHRSNCILAFASAALFAGAAGTCITVGVYSAVAIATPAQAASTSPEGEALIDAISQRRVETVQKLLRDGADPNYEPRYGPTPLGEAIQDNDLGAVKLLVEKGADVTRKRPRFDETSLCLAIDGAARSHDPRITKFLLEQGARISYEGDPARVLYDALKIDDADLFAQILRTASGLPNSTYATALKNAVDAERVTQVAALLAAGAKPSPDAVVKGISNLPGEKANHILSMLLAAGGRVDFSDPRAVAITAKRLEQGDLGLMSLVAGMADGLDGNALDDLLEAALHYSRPVLARMLLEKGANPNRYLQSGSAFPFSALDRGTTLAQSEKIADMPLLSATLADSQASPAGTALLIEFGADVNAIDGAGRRPIDYALLKWFYHGNDMTGIDLLLQHDAKVPLSARRDDPVRIALRRGAIQPVKKLLAQKSCLDADIKAAFADDLETAHSKDKTIRAIPNC